MSNSITPTLQVALPLKQLYFYKEGKPRKSIAPPIDLTALLLILTFTLQVISPTVTHVWRNVPVLRSTSDVRLRPFESVANRPLPSTSYMEVLNCLKFPPLISVPWARFCACAYQFLTTVTEGVVHSVHNLFIWDFTPLSTLYRSYHGGLLEGQRKHRVHRVHRVC